MFSTTMKRMVLFLMALAVLLSACISVSAPAACYEDGVCSVDEKFRGGCEDCKADFSLDSDDIYLNYNANEERLELSACVKNTGGEFYGDVPVELQLHTNRQNEYESYDTWLDFNDEEVQARGSIDVREGEIIVDNYFRLSIGDTEQYSCFWYEFEDVVEATSYSVNVYINTDYEQIEERDYENNHAYKSLEGVEQFYPDFLIESNISDFEYTKSYGYIRDWYTSYSANYEAAEEYAYVFMIDYSGSSAEYYFKSEIYWDLDPQGDTVIEDIDVSTYKTEYNGDVVYRYTRSKSTDYNARDVMVWESGDFVIRAIVYASYAGGNGLDVVNSSAIFDAYLAKFPSALTGTFDTATYLIEDTIGDYRHLKSEISNTDLGISQTQYVAYYKNQTTGIVPSILYSVGVSADELSAHFADGTADYELITIGDDVVYSVGSATSSGLYYAWVSGSDLIMFIIPDKTASLDVLTGYLAKYPSDLKAPVDPVVLGQQLAKVEINGDFVDFVFMADSATEVEIPLFEMSSDVPVFADEWESSVVESTVNGVDTFALSNDQALITKGDLILTFDSVVNETYVYELVDVDSNDGEFTLTDLITGAQYTFQDDGAFGDATGTVATFRTLDVLGLADSVTIFTDVVAVPTVTKAYANNPKQQSNVVFTLPDGEIVNIYIQVDTGYDFVIESGYSWAAVYEKSDYDEDVVIVATDDYVFVLDEERSFTIYERGAANPVPSTGSSSSGSSSSGSSS